MSIVGLAPLVFLAIAAAIFFGVVVQRLCGQAYGMVASPIVALVAPEYLPATVLLLGIVVGAGAISMDLSAVNWREAGPGFIGRAVGALAGAALAAVLTDKGGFGIVISLIVLLAVLLSLSGFRLAIRPITLVGAGLAAGIMGTITAIGAPPMALLYAREEAKRARAMQNLFFVWGMVCSIGALSVAGLVGAADLRLALALLPFVLLGFLAAHPAARALEGRSIRPLALGLASLAALTILGRSLA
ncbi:MAG: TSUP family transporter [Paracoccaceae bacterium]